MTDKPTLHIPQKDSPRAYLIASINSGDTILKVNDSSIFSLNNITRLTLGSEATITETVTVVSYQPNNEIVVLRGNPAYSWLTNTSVARVLTAQDMSEIIQFFTYLDEEVSNISGGLVTNGNFHTHSNGDGSAIPSDGIDNDAITSDKLANDAVIESTIANGAVTYEKIAFETIVTDNISPSAITQNKIASNAVGNLQLDDYAVDSQNIAEGAIDTDHIADLQITADKLASTSVISSKLSPNSVTMGKIFIPFCFISKSTNFNTVTSALTAVTFETAEIQAVNTMWDNGEPTKITIINSGFYQVSFFLFFSTGGTIGDWRQAVVSTNGSTNAAYVPVAGNCRVDNTANKSYLNGSGPFYFTVGDYIQLLLQTSAVVSCNGARLSVRWLSG